MKDIDKADQIAADLVSACYGQQGVMACVIRADGNELRIIAPADSYKPLALMLYRAADELAARAPAPFSG
jgi:hypothetical protein